MASILHWASAFAVMRRIIRSRDGRPYRRRPLRTPLPVRRALVWQQDRWPVQLIPSTLWLGLASNPSARACDHVQRWSQSLTSNYRYVYKSAQVWHGGAWTKLLRHASIRRGAGLTAGGSSVAWRLRRHRHGRP